MPQNTYRSASGSSAEDLFIELFSETFGAEKAGYLYSQYHFYDIYQNDRFADFFLENGARKIAIEIDDEASHNKNIISRNKFYDDLLKQNSMVHLGWDVFRWAVKQMQVQPDTVKDELRVFIGSNTSFREVDDYLPTQRGKAIDAFDFRLKEHQTEALKSLEEMRSKHETIALLYHATGTGKTVTAISDAKRVGKRTLFIAHTHVLVEQAAQTFGRLWSEVSVGRFVDSIKQPDSYDEQFINSANDTDDRKTDLISSMTIHELLSSDKYRHFINDFFEHLNLRIDNSGLSGKALRYLGKSGITEFNKLFVLYPDRIVSVAGSSNAVADELKKYIENTVDNYRLSINRYCCGDEQALYTDNFIKSQIMNVFGNAGFDGKSFAEMRAVIPEAVDEKRIRKAVAQLIKERKLEYVDFRCYKVYPSYQSYLREFIESLEENQRVMLCRRLKLNFKKWLKNSSNCGIIILKERTGKVPDNIFKGIV